MSRYYHPTRYTSRDRQSLPAPTQTHQSWFKSPVILSAILLGIGTVGATLFIEFTTQRIIHIRADDNSDSAATYTAQRQQHCQASIQQYKPGDVAISMSFADRPVTNQKISILNSLSLLGQCKDTKRAIANKQPGTSLILLLDRIQNTVKKERARNNLNPVAATIAIQDDEPGPNQPNPKDIQRIKTAVRTITENNGALAFMVEDETLKNQLETHLASEGNVQICDFKDISNCVSWALENTRRSTSK